MVKLLDEYNNYYNELEQQLIGTLERAFVIRGEDLPESYDKELFQSKITLLLNHFIDMAIQGYGWISHVAY